MTTATVIKGATTAVTALAAVAFVARPHDAATDLPNRIPEAAPYLTSEAQVFPPPYEEYWATQNHPGQCANCHRKIFDEWNGSMMSNSWRDPVWRAAFLLLARAVSTNGECDTPTPPDGTPKATHNPFALAGQCASSFDIGTGKVTVSRPGSLLDAFCSRCHMPTNYVDNVPLRNVKLDATTGIETAIVDPKFNPTSDNGTGVAFATLESQFRNTETGKAGIFCAVCHSYATTRDTPFHNYPKAPDSYAPAVGRRARDLVVQPQAVDVLSVSDPSQRNLGYAIGAGAYRLSPHALAFPERIGPLLAAQPAAPATTPTPAACSATPSPTSSSTPRSTPGCTARSTSAPRCAPPATTSPTRCRSRTRSAAGSAAFRSSARTRSGWAAATRIAPATPTSIRSSSATASRATCSRTTASPGRRRRCTRTASRCRSPASRSPPTASRARRSRITSWAATRWCPHLIGKDVDAAGAVAPYPELSTFSFSSADHKSPYSRGFWTNVDRKGGYAQQQRLAWDRLRNVLSMTVRGPATAAAGSRAPIAISVANTGSGHNFPTGFPEGRIAWVAVHAHDLATGSELKIRDSYWKRSSVGIGNLTTKQVTDPAFPGCDWELPAGSADPFSIQFKAVASLGNGCPTLDLPYAAPLNMVTDARGLPIDEKGRVIDAASNPRGLPQFKDANGNGDLFDDSFLRDTPPASAAPSGRHAGNRSLRDRDPGRDRRPDRGQRRGLLPVGRGDRGREVPGQHGRPQHQLRARALRAGRPVRRPRAAQRARRRRGRAAGADDRPQLGDRDRRRGRRPDAAPLRRLSRTGRPPRLPGRRRQGRVLGAGQRRRRAQLHAHRRDRRAGPRRGGSDRPGHVRPVPPPRPPPAGRDVHRAPRGRGRRRRRQPHHGRAALDLHHRHRTRSMQPATRRSPPAFSIPSQSVVLSQTTKRKSKSAKGKHHGHL